SLACMKGYPPNPALALVADGAALDVIARHAAGCVSCDLYEDATQTVFGKGPVPATFLLAGEQPGDSEDREGVPFVGPAARVLDRALDGARLARRVSYVTTVVNHVTRQPGRGSKPRHRASPNRTEVLAGRPWLDAEIIRLGPA